MTCSMFASVKDFHMLLGKMATRVSMKLALVAFSQTWPSTSWRVGKRPAFVEDVGEHKADHAGDGSGDEEIRHGLPADGADLLHVAHGDDAVDHRQQHDGHDDELEEVNEDGTKE